MGSSAIVQKLWNYCNVLRDDGVSYGDYVERLRKREEYQVNTFDIIRSTMAFFALPSSRVGEDKGT